jgi:PKD repeat protein
VTFAPGETTKTITVQVWGDWYDEADETIYIHANVIGAVWAQAGVGTIVDDDSAVRTDLAATSGGIARDDNGDGTFTQLVPGDVNGDLKVSKTLPSGSDHRVLLEFNVGSINAGSVGSVTFEFYQNHVQYHSLDPHVYAHVLVYGYAANGTVSLADATAPGVLLGAYDPEAGNGWRSITLDRAGVQSLLGSATHLGLRFVGLPEASTAFYNINGFYPPKLSFHAAAAPAVPAVSVSDASRPEGSSAGDMVFTVSLSQAPTVPTAVTWETANGTAAAGSDYARSHGVLIFHPGETSKTVTVRVNTDTIPEPHETFTLQVGFAANATIADGTGIGTILNTAPVANAGPDVTANEGSNVAFSGSGSTDAENDPLTYSWNFGDGTTGSGVNATHAYADNGTYTVTLTVSDGVSSSTDTMVVTVQNVAPGAHIEGPWTSVRGQPMTLTFSTSEPSSADRAAPMTYIINWGDGTNQTIEGAASGIQVGHVYTASGSYTVTVTATDKDGGTGTPVSRTVTIAAAELQGGDLYVGGTTGADQITITPEGTGAVRVVVNGQDLGAFTLGLTAPGTGGVIVFGQAGNDTIELVGVDGGSGTLTFPYPAALFGDDGDDILDARAANGQIIQHGGAGNDVLWGGRGRDLLIGGLGADTLRGGDGEDLLLGGTTDYDTDFIALALLSAEWVRTDADFTTRVQHLTGQQSGGHNGTRYLDAQSVNDDGVADDLFGEAGADWFIRTGGAAVDNVNDGDASDLLTTL